MVVKKKQHHKVLKNTDSVRKVIDLYVDMFKNYQKAAESIGINKDTIAQYKTHRTNISLAIFEKISEVVNQHYTQEEILQCTEGVSLKEIKAQAQARNGAQIDHVMYIINDKIYAILKLYCSIKESYADAAKSLDINPRTFKAYILRQTLSFPRKYFWAIISQLNEYGYSSQKLMKMINIKKWEDIIEEKRRSATICPTKSSLKEELIKCFQEGKIRQRDINTSLHNASKRLYGSLGKAIRETMKELTKRMDTKVREFLLINDLEKAYNTLEEFNRYIDLYEENERAVNKALPKNKKIKWENIVENYRTMAIKLLEQIEEKKAEINKRTLEELNGILPSANENNHIQLKTYSLSEVYDKGDLLNHPAYGAGKVIKNIGERYMIVQFGKRYGKKILIMNDKNPRPEFENLNHVS